MAVGTMIAKTSSSMNANRHLSCQHWLLLIIVGVIFFHESLLNGKFQVVLQANYVIVARADGELHCHNDHFLGIFFSWIEKENETQYMGILQVLCIPFTFLFHIDQPTDSNTCMR